nr:hypothetical protein [Tanacetum cinerariifolium]
MTKMVKEQGGLTQINDEDFHTCMFACFHSQEEPKRVHQALKDPSWIEAMQEELLQFKMQKVWVLVDLPKGKRAIDSKWIFRNKKDERGIVIKNKARLVAQGHTQEEGIDYEEVFAPVTKIEAIRLFLAYASFMGFMVYQMDVKSAFLYGTIEEEAGKIDQTLFLKKQKGDILLVQKQDGIFISQDKYVAVILRKFGLTDGKSASTPIDTKKPLLKDPDGKDVDVHTYRSMIGSLMYLTSSRLDIMFVACACAHFQVTPKASHLHAVKRIFRYLKGKPHLGLWYPKDSPFNLVAYSDSDYAGASLDRKSTTRGCQFLAAASCCAQVLWIQNQLLDYSAVRSKLMLFGLTIDDVHLMLLGHKVSVLGTNDVVRLQALIDRMKVIITEDMVRQALRLDDADSIDCLPNKEIFTELARMGVGKGFSGVDTLLFNGMLVPQQVQDDVADATEDEDATNEISTEPTPPSPTPATTPPTQQELIPSSSQDKIAQAIEITKLKQKVRRLEKKRKLKASGFKRLRKVGTAQRVESSADTVMDDQEDASKQWGITELDANEDITLETVNETDEAEPAEVEEVLEVVTATKLMTEVVTTATTPITTAPVPKASALRKRRGVIIQDPKEAATTSLSVKSEMILLVERRYPLTRFTLEQMLNNVRLEVEEESEVSMELLRFVRRQQQEEESAAAVEKMKRLL